MATPTLLADPSSLHLRLLDASETAIQAIVVTTSQERVERYHKVRELLAQGAELTLIAHQVGISRTTVNKYLNMEHPLACKTGKRSGSVIDPYKEYIVKRRQTI